MTNTWIDHEGRTIDIKTMSDIWLNNIRKKFKGTEKVKPIIYELKRRKAKKREEEANYFAVCILIPKELILKELDGGIDLMDDKKFIELCKKFHVTPAMMTYRLSKLKLFKNG